MSPEQMREVLKKAYSYAESWSAKVDKMGDHQVAAIYTRMLHQKQL